MDSMDSMASVASMVSMDYVDSTESTDFMDSLDSMAQVCSSGWKKVITFFGPYIQWIRTWDPMRPMGSREAHGVP